MMGNNKYALDDAFKDVENKFAADDAFKEGYPISFPESYKEAPIENCNPRAKMDTPELNYLLNEPVTSKSNKKKIVLIVLLVVILLVASTSAYVYYVVKQKNNLPIDPNENLDVVIDENKEYGINELSGLRKDNNSNYTNSYTFSYASNKYDNYYVCNKKMCDKTITVKTKNQDIEYDMNYKNKYIFYIDGDEYKILDINSGESYIINLEASATLYSSIVVSVNEVNDRLEGAIITVNESDNSSFFSFKLNKNIYDREYGLLRYINDGYIEATKEDCLIDETGKRNECVTKSKLLLSANGERIIKEFDYTSDMKENDEMLMYSILYSKKDPDKKIYIEEQVTDGNNFMSTIYNKNFGLVVGMVEYGSYSISSDGLINVVTPKDVKVYNNNGDVVKINNSYKALMVIEDYIVAVKNGNLILATFDGKEKVVTKWNSSKNDLDTYYSKTVTETKNSINGKHVIYLEDRENNKAWYYDVDEDKVGETSVSSYK